MKQKTIKSVLSRKIRHWLEHIDDEAVKKTIENHVIVSGGAIASMFMGEEVNDYDIYFRTSDAAAAVARYYVKKLQENPPPQFKETKGLDMDVQIEGDRVMIFIRSAGIAGEENQGVYRYFETLPPQDAEAAHDYVQDVAQALDDEELEDKGSEDQPKGRYRPLFMTSNAITLSDKVQIVIRFTGEIDKIHENYDFTHCKCAYDYANRRLGIHPEALECMLNKELRYMSSRYPLCSIIRTRKFLNRGWHINAGQYVKMAWDLNKLDLTDIHVLEDQMVGVDAAYFLEVIDLLKKRLQDGKTVDDTYLFEVIDKVF